MHVAVLGGGISGITTATLLQARGYETTLVTAACAHTRHGADTPRFASLYPAASVIPHTVRIANQARHTRWSQLCFDVFRDLPGWGVRTQRHAELFETPPSHPPYLEALRNCVHLPNNGSGRLDVPHRPGTSTLYGWVFDMTFVEAPRYLRSLYQLYQAMGGSIHRQYITSSNRAALPGDLWVNCLGYGASSVFHDPAPASYLHGHLIHVVPPISFDIVQKTTSFISYNYQPDFDVYPTPDGTPGGIYFYPRRNVWLVGGTKHPATPEGGYATPLRAPTTRIHGVTIPEAMWTTNAVLIKQLVGVDIQNASFHIVSGLRYLRNPSGSGVRLTWDNSPERPTIHNYGHGGAGVTLSWSCALHAVHAIEQKIAAGNFTPSHPQATALRAKTDQILATAPTSVIHEET